MNTSKLVTLIFIIVLFISCGNETIKTVEITPLNMSDAVVHQDGPKNYSYYKNVQRGDLLTFKAVCTTANMVKDKNSNVSWHVEYNGEELHLPLYSDNGKPIFIPNHNELSVFLSNIDTLGTYTIKAVSYNGKSECIKIYVLSSFKIENSIVLSSSDMNNEMSVNNNTTLIRGKIYSFRLTNALSFGNVTWTVKGGGKNDRLVTQKCVAHKTSLPIGEGSVSTFGNEGVYLHLTEDNITSPLFLTVSTPTESHTITIKGVPPKTDASLPFPTFAPFPIINGYEIKVFMPSEAKKDRYKLEISRNNGFVWSTVDTNENNYYSETVTRVENFNIDETVIIKARIKDIATGCIGNTAEFKLILESFPGTVRFCATPTKLLLPTPDLDDEKWKNYSANNPLLTLDISSAFDEIKNILHKETLLMSSEFSIYKKSKYTDDVKTVLNAPILNEYGELNEYSIKIPMYSSNDTCTVWGNTSSVKGFAPHALVKGTDSYDAENITDIFADVNIIPYVFTQGKEEAYYRISIHSDNAVLPPEKSWIIAVHYRNTENNTDDITILRGVDFINENGNLVHILCDKNGKALQLKTNSVCEQIRMMILPSSRIVENMYYTPFVPIFDDSVWWNTTLNPEYLSQHIILQTCDEIQKYTNRRIALITLYDVLFKAEYAIDDDTTNINSLKWLPVDVSSSGNAEIILFEKEEDEKTLFIKVSSLATGNYYIITENVSLIPCKMAELKNYTHTKNNSYRHADESRKADLISFHPYIMCTHGIYASSSHSDNGGGSLSYSSVSKWTKYEKGEYPLTLYSYSFNNNGHTEYSSSSNLTHYILLRDFGYLDNKVYFASDGVLQTSSFTNGIKFPQNIVYRQDINSVIGENI